MYGYLCFYNGKTAEVYAESLYQAKQQAVEAFKVRKNKAHLVSVVLCERPDGSVVEHSTGEF